MKNEDERSPIIGGLGVKHLKEFIAGALIVIGCASVDAGGNVQTSDVSSPSIAASSAAPGALVLKSAANANHPEYTHGSHRSHGSHSSHASHASHRSVGR